MAYITINRDNFFFNLDQIKQKVGSIDKIAIVLKDNAYGHGIRLIAKLSHEYGIKHAVVKNTQEALEIKAYFQTVLILNDTPIEDSKLYFSINSITALHMLHNKANIELKIDTGMHRNGIAMEEIDEAIELIESKKLNLKGIMTHFRSADELSSELFWQQKNFAQSIAKLKNTPFTAVRVHSQNSSATLRMKHFDEDLVRIGISAYGYNELGSTFDPLELRPIISLYTNKVTSRKLTQSSCIGYGGEGILARDSVVSTYDIGYGDGWLRASKNMPIDDTLQIVGRVSMDFITINSDKETVCIMNNAQKVARYCDTISYEITTRLDHQIKRVII